MTRSFLVLESGEIFAGALAASGQTFERAGEVVFNTSHSGYEEIATDPSYFSQIVVMTAPMMGNYGVNDLFWESKKIWIEGFVCLQIQNTQRENSWLRRLQDHCVPLLSEVDTRALTLRLRDGGTPWGAIVSAESEIEASRKASQLIVDKKSIDKDWVFQASRKTTEVQQGLFSKGPRIAVLDFGAKENILRELRARASEVVIFNSRTSSNEILAARPSGLMLTNGPGDPSDVQIAVDTVKTLISKLPIFGICMGHQILGLALGAKTYKLKFGHRGSNHPIRDELLNQIYMTSQNHGYAVERESLPADVRVTHVNLNDQTVAGVHSEAKNCLGVQFHPESHPGPHESRALFDFFVNQMMKRENNL